MFALFVTAKIKPGHRAEFIEATMGDAVGSNNDEPGCMQFDVHADPNDENTVYSTIDPRMENMCSDLW